MPFYITFCTDFFFFCVGLSGIENILFAVYFSLFMLLLYKVECAL